ncbi:Glycine decarboxlase H-protein (GDC-H) [Chara braunii]|uniref:Glycine decarboxlase H-protein (GDC-H) n=1 Tax=Chara braunii TaxID=69332 RepID=A0A388M6N8_CHABU|nr:Glycine decarboxlase H-protein (GDC-H) [Chara braunii]|eukprot:GBG90254.1 Glycine decarboxlase H-protein (GDC-H) [Chara braunii]
MALRTLASRVATGVRCHYRQSLVSSSSSSSGSARLLLPLLRGFSSTITEADCKFLKSHEYVSIDDKIGTVGISDFAQVLS